MDRVQKAVDLFKSGCNCAQAIVCAYSDLFDIDENTVMRMSEGFGGGMGRMRLTCGAVSGMAMLAGMKESRGIPKDIPTRTKVYGVIQNMAKEFEEKNGSVICGDLLGVTKPKDTGAAPTERNNEFYKKRPCIGCIEDCARLVEKYLIDEIGL